MVHPNGFYEKDSGYLQYFYISEDTGNYCEPHFHSSIEIIVALESGFRIIVDGNELILNRGDIAYINSLQVHFYPCQNIRTCVLVIGINYLANFQNVFGQKSFDTVLPAKSSAMSELFPLINNFLKKQNNSSAPFFELEKIGFINSFLGILSEHYVPVSHNRRTDSSVIVDILYDIEENFNKNISVLHYAEKYGYSRTYISFLFNEYTGMHFRDYLNQLRIKHALSFLENKKTNKDTILNIASKCGFDSIKTFYRALKKFGSDTDNK